MSAQDTAEVGSIVGGLLGEVNAGFNWDVVRERFDPDPVGKSITLHFLNEDGETLAEKVTLGVADGPELVLVGDDGDPRFENVGDVVTYQDYGLRVLDPDDNMTPEAARYQYNGVNIETAEGESRERVWLIASTILNIMLESIIREQNGGQ
jgi:hypothetical protein